MKILFDLFPVLLFFVAYRFSDIYTATGVAIAATVLQISWAYFVRKKIEPMMWFTLAVVVIFGSLTLIFHNPTFIKWKPTVLYWGMASGIAVSLCFFGRNPLRSMLGSQLELPAQVWTRLTWSWIGFFAVMGALNLVVAYQFSEATWVNFKAFGGTALMLVFVIAQSLFLSRYIEEDKK
jgi:intracellular septation protein